MNDEETEKTLPQNDGGQPHKGRSDGPIEERQIGTEIDRSNDEEGLDGEPPHSITRVNAGIVEDNYDDDDELDEATDTTVVEPTGPSQVLRIDDLM